jgi:hypothetical protein
MRRVGMSGRAIAAIALVLAFAACANDASEDDAAEATGNEWYEGFCAREVAYWWPSIDASALYDNRPTSTEEFSRVEPRRQVLLAYLSASQATYLAGEVASQEAPESLAGYADAIAAAAVREAALRDAAAEATSADEIAALFAEEPAPLEVDPVDALFDEVLAPFVDGVDDDGDPRLVPDAPRACQELASLLFAEKHLCETPTGQEVMALAPCK